MKLFFIAILACGLLLGGCKDEVATSPEVKATAHESATVVEQVEHVASEVTEQAQHAAAEVVEQATEVVDQAETHVTDVVEKVSTEGSHMVDGLLNSATELEEEGSDALSSAVDSHK